jgi:hypothetical protein
VAAVVTLLLLLLLLLVTIGSLDILAQYDSHGWQLAAACRHNLDALLLRARMHCLDLNCTFQVFEFEFEFELMWQHHHAVM